VSPCPVCGGPLGRNKNACSHACNSILRSNVKSCIICGESFQAPPSSEKVTCSPSCSTENRRQIAAAGINTPAIQKAHEQLPHSPLTGQFETHMHAKTWVIQSPTGEVYRCRNLKLWLRENEDLLDGTVKQAWDGFAKMKASQLGRRKRPLNQWKGWRLLEFSDE